MTDAIRFVASHRGEAILLNGSNFSGRTELLQRWAAQCSRGGQRSAYVGPSVHLSVSSLVPTVRDELQLHLTGSRHGESILGLAESFGLDRCFRQSPFTLSGGEQTLLVALCKLALEPALLAFDGAFEELDPVNASRLVELFGSPAARETATLISMNGYPEDRSWKFAVHLETSELRTSSGAVDPPRFDAADFLPAAPKTSGALMVEGLSFAYSSGRPILRDLSYNFEPGRIYSIEGRNGAGKSTLARILVGALRCRRGRIAFGGRLLDPWRTPGQIAVMHMQNPDVQLFASTVADELADLPPLSRPAAAALAGVEHLAGEHPFDLAFVLRKRLTFSAVAHLCRPWFIFDEPTLGQDAHACDQMVAVLKRLAGTGAGVIVISHSREFIRRLQARRLRLEDGQIRELNATKN